MRHPGLETGEEKRLQRLGSGKVFSLWFVLWKRVELCFCKAGHKASDPVLVKQQSRHCGINVVWHL